MSTTPALQLSTTYAPPASNSLSMEVQVYSLGGEIEHFFNTFTTTSRAECDAKATSIIGGPVKPLLIQGACSYTVTGDQADLNIVQFRAGISKLNMAHVNISREIHPWCVPKCVYHGQTDGQMPLSIYVMDKCDGLCYIQARDLSPEGNANFQARQSRTVADLARFFAEAWNSPQQVPPPVASLRYNEIENDLACLSEKLPDRFMATLNQVREELPRIKILPFVITHGDLNETNIFVDNGKVTGIIDWAECQVLTFGMALWGLENILGCMDGAGWHYHDNAEVLRDEFWRVFEMHVGGLQEEARMNIRLSRMVGLFLRHGFEQEGSARGKVRDTDFALRYADAFCTTGV